MILLFIKEVYSLGEGIITYPCIITSPVLFMTIIWTI